MIIKVDATKKHISVNDKQANSLEDLVDFVFDKIVTKDEKVVFELLETGQPFASRRLSMLMAGILKSLKIDVVIQFRYQ